MRLRCIDPGKSVTAKLNSAHPRPSVSPPDKKRRVECKERPTRVRRQVRRKVTITPSIADSIARQLFLRFVPWKIAPLLESQCFSIRDFINGRSWNQFTTGIYIVYTYVVFGLIYTFEYALNLIAYDNLKRPLNESRQLSSNTQKVKNLPLYIVYISFVSIKESFAKCHRDI